MFFWGVDGESPGIHPARTFLCGYGCFAGNKFGLVSHVQKYLPGHPGFLHFCPASAAHVASLVEPRKCEFDPFRSTLDSPVNVRIVLFKHSKATPVDIIGTWEDVQFAIHVFHFLRMTFSRCWSEFKLSAGFPERKSYYRGLHDGLRTAILKGKKRAEATASSEERNQYQIVLVDTAAAIDRYMGEKYGKLRKRRGRRSRVDSESYQAGRAKGGTIKINRTLPGGAE